MRFVLKLLLFFFGIGALYISIVAINQFSYILDATKGERIDPNLQSNSTLLVIDIQQTLPITMPTVNDFLASTNQAIDHFRKQNGEVVFVAQVKEEKSLRSIFLPHIAARGSKEAALYHGLHAGNPILFTKLKADAFSNPEFEEYLKAKGVGKLYITGMAAEVCVDYTIQGALNRGYEVYVIDDAVLAIFGDASKQKRFDKYAKLGAKIISLQKFVTMQ